MITESGRGRELWLFLSIVGVAAVLRGLGLGSDGLWVDEAYTAEIIRGSWGEIIQRLRADDAPPLFYFLETIGTVFGSSEAALRLLPCLAGIATVAVALGLALSQKRDLGLRPAVFVGLTFATSTLLVFYAQQARSYSWVHLLELGLLASTFALRRREADADAPSTSAGSARLWPTLWITSALGLLYLHNLAFLPVTTAALLWAPRFRSNLQRTGTVLGLTLLGSVPWALSVWQQIETHRSLNTWMGEWWTDRVLALGPLYSVGVFTNGIAPYFRPPIPLPGLDSLSSAGASPLLQFGTLIGLAAVLVGLGFGLRTRGRMRELAGGAILFTVLPLVGLLVVSWILGPTYVVGRTDTFALPGFLLWIAIGWATAPRRLGALCLLSWIALGLIALVGPGNTRTEKGSDRELAEILAARAAPGEPVYVGLLGQPSLRYYGRRFGFAEEGQLVRGFPHIAEAEPATASPLPTDSLSVYLQEARLIRESVESTEVDAVWVTSILHDPPPTWPGRPLPPPAGRSWRSANDLSYPTSLLVYTFVGLDSVEVAAEYQQDWVTGSRVLLRIPRSQWKNYDELPPIEEQG